MRRSTPGVFGSVESHSPRVCGPKSNSSFRACSDDSRRCVPPPVPCRNQPPPLPPKHHLRKNTGIEFSKHREPPESLDSYGRYVYESISESNVSSRSNRNPTLPRSYVTRDFPQPGTTIPLGFRSVSPHAVGINCGSGGHLPNHASYNTRSFKFPLMAPFAVDPGPELPKGSCTCSLGAGKGPVQPYNSRNQSPVWSKMPSMVVRPSDLGQPKSSNSTPRESGRQEKKSSSVENRPWTISRFSRTMSRFFRWKTSHRKGKSSFMRSRSVYLTDLQDKFNVNTTIEPSSLSVGYFLHSVGSRDIFKPVSLFNYQHFIC